MSLNRTAKGIVLVPSLLLGGAFLAAAVWLDGPALANRPLALVLGGILMGMGGGVLESMGSALLADLFPARRKFFLNLSRGEQKKRFLARIDDPDKNWKFHPADVRERQHWDEYMAAYESAIRETATAEAPWYVVPADNKWFTRLVVAAAIVDTLSALDPTYPTLPPGKLAELAECRKVLAAEDRDG